MAIDFGRIIQGVATGAMGQYNAEVAAKDKMKGEIIQRAGLNFYENTLPEFEKKEKSRKETYDKLAGQFGVDVAEYMGQNNFITGDANDYKNILIQLGDNPEIKADKLKQYLKETLYIIIVIGRAWSNIQVQQNERRRLENKYQNIFSI